MLIACDFDGTITDIDTTDLILSQFAAPEWREIEQEWLDGKIGSAECMKRQVELIYASRQELDDLIDSIEIAPYFKELVQNCKSSKIPLVVLSDGIDYAINRILANHNIHGLEVRANRLVEKIGGGYSLAFQNSGIGCQSGNCKCRRVWQEELLTIYIGDGKSDFCVSSKVDLVIAKAELLDYCREKKLFHVPFTGFSEASELILRINRDCYDNPAKIYAKPQLKFTPENMLHI